MRQTEKEPSLFVVNKGAVSACGQLDALRKLRYQPAANKLSGGAKDESKPVKSEDEDALGVATSSSSLEADSVTHKVRAFGMCTCGLDDLSVLECLGSPN